MSRPIASRSFPASPAQLRNIRDFVTSAFPDRGEHLALLATEIASLLLAATPSITIRLEEDGDRIALEARLDAVREGTSLDPGALAQRVMEGLTDELAIDLDQLVVTARTPVDHPVYTIR